MKRFIEGQDRAQITLLPECGDDYIAEENPVRVVEAFVDQLEQPRQELHQSQDAAAHGADRSGLPRVICPEAFCPDWAYATEVRPLLGYGLGIGVGADAPESSRSRTCVASTKSKRTVPSLNVSPAWNALSLSV